MQPSLTVSYRCDALCGWAYAAQFKLDELRRQFGEHVRVDYRFPHLFRKAIQLLEKQDEVSAAPDSRFGGIHELLAEPGDQFSWC